MNKFLNPPRRPTIWERFQTTEPPTLPPKDWPRLPPATALPPQMGRGPGTQQEEQPKTEEPDPFQGPTYTAMDQDGNPHQITDVKHLMQRGSGPSGQPLPPEVDRFLNQPPPLPPKSNTQGGGQQPAVPPQ